MTIGCVGAAGSGAAGSMPAGSGFGLSIFTVRQDTLNSAIVTFNVAPRANDPGDVRDALDAQLWTLTALGSARARLVQDIERVPGDSLSVHVFFDGPLSPSAQYQLAVAASVTAATGGVLGGCSSAVFSTLAWPRDLVPSPTVTLQSVDVANPQMPRDAPSLTSPLGTYQIGPTGDWINDSGRTGLRKRVIRRLTTPEGAFFHIPQYGDAPAIGTLIRDDELRRMQQTAKRGIQSEPDVVSATVEVQRVPGDHGIVLVIATVQDIYGTDGMTVSAQVRVRRR